MVFWDRLAVQLINKTAAQLKFLGEEVFSILFSWLSYFEYL